VLAIVSACLVAAHAWAQVPAPQWPVNGVDYRFKRMVTKRFVDDGVDQGWIKLVSYVYQPLQGRGDVAIVLHGSTGGMASSPNEPLNVKGFPVDFLLSRGITVVVHPGACSLADSRARRCTASSRFPPAGCPSQTNGRRRKMLRRLELQRALLADAGSRFDGPTLWVYAARDPFYPDSVTRQFFDAWKSSGGSGRYLFIDDHRGATGHTPGLGLWQADAVRFLEKFGL
jgi:hypothetical protein